MTGIPPGPRALAPSERVFFHGEAFARSRGIADAFELMHKPAKVRASDLARSVIAAALLAAEKEGALSLRVGAKRRLLGLRRTPALVASPGPRIAPFPLGSYEARAIATVQREGEVPVDRLVHELLADDATLPHELGLFRVQEGLAHRGLLDVDRTNAPTPFHAPRYRLPARTATLAAREGTDDVAQLFDTAQRTRPEMWRLLQHDVDAGLKSRARFDLDLE